MRNASPGKGGNRRRSDRELPERKGASKSDSQGAHIKRRMAATGQTYAQAAAEFGTSKTTAHRRAKAQDNEFMRTGFTKLK